MPCLPAKDEEKWRRFLNPQLGINFQGDFNFKTSFFLSISLSLFFNSPPSERSSESHIISHSRFEIQDPRVVHSKKCKLPRVNEKSKKCNENRNSRSSYHSIPLASFLVHRWNKYSSTAATIPVKFDICVSGGNEFETVLEGIQFSILGLSGVWSLASLQLF